MAAPTVYRSTDTSAPQLDGTAGTLVAVLDGCLVNGYGSKAAAGWTKAFTATNKGSYLGTAGHYLDVNDSGAGAATTQEANVRGYESMTAVATGTGPFPTTSQAASPGLYVRKSAAATSTARSWLLIADGTTFHLFILSGDTAGIYRHLSFGRFYSFESGDAYRSVLSARAATGTSATGSSHGLESTTSQTSLSSTSGLYIPRTYLGTGTSKNAGFSGVGSALWGTPFDGPNPPDGNVYLSRIFLHEGGGVGTAGLRGYFRGLYQILTAANLSDGDTFSGATGTDFAGRSFIILNKLAGNAYLAIETTAWDSSS